MKYCSLCEKEFPNDLMHCPECGKFLENAPPGESIDGNTIVNKKENQELDMGKPGVYKIVNKRTGEVYVSYSRNIEKGITEHIFNLRSGHHHNEHIKEDYNNGDRFDFIILEMFDQISEYMLVRKWREWIKKEESYKFGYNRQDGFGYNPNNPIDTIFYSPGGRLKDKEKND